MAHHAVSHGAVAGDMRRAMFALAPAVIGLEQQGGLVLPPAMGRAPAAWPVIALGRPAGPG
jgi:hypothetical protein